jgi:hypothetical protein
MLIRIFRSGYTIKVTMFFIIAFLLWIPAFINLPAPITESTYGIAYDFLFGYFQPGAILSTVIAFVLLLFQAIVFNAVLVSKPLFSRSVFLPAMIYVVLMSHNPAMLTLHPALIANFFLILALSNLYDTYEKNDPYRETFNSSFWIAMATLFYLPAAWMMIFLWSAFIIFRISGWREWIISLIGFAVPLILFAAGSYILDGFAFASTFYPSGFKWLISEFAPGLAEIVFWSVYTVVFLVSYYKFTVERSNNTIQVRKAFAVVNAFLITSVLTVFISGPNPLFHSHLVFPASSVIISYYFIEREKSIWTEILFAVLLIVIMVIKVIA